MAHQITGVDHLSFAVSDSAVARQAFARLGFFVSPPLVDDASGTLTQCVAFAADHLELSGPAGPGPGSRHLLRMPGLGLGSRDIQASYESLRRAGIDLRPPAPRTPSLVHPDSVLALPEDLLPGLPAVLCRSSDGLRRPEWREHPNTARGIVSLSLLLDDPEAAIGDYNRLFGPAASTPTDTMVTVHTGHGLIFLVTPDGFDDLHPSLDLRLPPPPAMVVLTVGVADLARAAAVLAANGVSAERRGGHLGVPAADAPGIGLEFVEA